MKKATKNGLIALAATIGIISVHSAAHAQSLLPGEHDWQPWDIVETIPGEHGKTFCIADNKSLYECSSMFEPIAEPPSYHQTNDCYGCYDWPSEPLIRSWETETLCEGGPCPDHGRDSNYECETFFEDGSDFWPCVNYMQLDN